MQVLFIRAIYKKTAAAADLVDDGAIELFGDSGAAFAATQVTAPVDVLFADVVGGMYDDGAVVDIVIPALLYAFETQ